MAQTYRAVVAGATFAATKHMLSIFNGAGSGRVLRVKRIWQLNNQTAAVTGVLTTMEVRRISSQSGGTSQTPIKMDTASENMPAQVLTATGATAGLTADAAYMRYMWSNDEPAASTLSSDETETIPLLSCIFDATGDTDVEALTLRAGEGVSVYHNGSTAVGICDIIIEFTMAAT
jgi:hypothetical protein